MLGTFQNSFSLVLRFKKDRNPHLKFFSNRYQLCNRRVTPWEMVANYLFPCTAAPNRIGNTGNKQSIKKMYIFSF